MKMVVLACGILCTVSVCHGMIITVDDNGPADFNTIQAAINVSGSGDVVEVQPGIYTGLGNRDINFLGKAITVRSIEPNNPDIVAATIIDCQGTSTEPHRGFYFNSNEGATSVINGFTITHGYHDFGGAVHCGDYCNPTIANCRLEENSASQNGGAIYGQRSSMIISRCIIRNNTAAVYGGGIRCCIDSSPQIMSCDISYNSAGDDGGGIEACSSDPNISDCVMMGNTSPYDGGALFTRRDSRLTRCIISGNSADRGGGVACLYEGHARIINCTIANNQANAGGGIFCDRDVHPSLVNTILWADTANKGPEVAIDDHYGYPSSLAVTYCDIQGGREAMSVAPSCTVEWGIGNIDADPLFADAANSDYHLKSAGWRWNEKWQEWDFDRVSSRCIDAGNPGSPLWDEIMSVPVDPNNEWGENLRIDMGGYGGTAEASIPPYNWAILSDLTNDGIVDFNDFALQAKDWQVTGEEQPGDPDRNGIVNMEDLGLFVEDWLQETSWHRN